MPESLPATTIRNLRVLGLIEGASFLVLLLIAMPLKYLGGMPAACATWAWRTDCCSCFT